MYFPKTSLLIISVTIFFLSILSIFVFIYFCLVSLSIYKLIRHFFLLFPSTNSFFLFSILFFIPFQFFLSLLRLTEFFHISKTPYSFLLSFRYSFFYSFIHSLILSSTLLLFRLIYFVI